MEEIIESCLEQVNFNAIKAFYHAYFGNKIISAEDLLSTDVAMSYSWIGRVITIDLLTNTAREVINLLFKNRNTTNRIFHAGFEVAFIDVDEIVLLWRPLECSSLIEK